MSEVVQLQPRRRSRASVAKPPVLIAKAPPLADELDGNRVSYAGWVCVLLIAGLAVGGWAIALGALALVFSGLR